MKILYPMFRQNLLGCIDFLADSMDRQLIAVTDSSGVLKAFMDFNLVINLIYDDIPYLTSDVDRAIGETLYDKKEGAAISAMVKALNEVLDVDYPDDIDAVYVKTPRWREVVSTAKEALAIMQVNEALHKSNT